MAIPELVKPTCAAGALGVPVSLIIRSSRISPLCSQCDFVAACLVLMPIPAGRQGQSLALRYKAQGCPGGALPGQEPLDDYEHQEMRYWVCPARRAA